MDDAMDGSGPCGGAVEESCLSQCSPLVEPEVQESLSECVPPVEAEAFRICRICLDDAEDEQNPLISPCRCTGTMRYIHRSCLDQWRTSSFQPRALMECTTCGVAFRTEYRGPARRAPKTRKSWWLQFGVDVLWYLGLRFSGLTVSVAVLGFWPGLLLAEGPIILHANPFASHLLVGLYSFFFLVGTFIVARVAFLHRLSFRIPGWNKWRPGRLDKVDIGMVLIVIGVLCCLFLLFRGIYQITVQGREEVWKSIRGVNEKVRKQVVKDYVILNYEEEIGSRPEGTSQEASQPPSECAGGMPVEAARE